MRKRPPICRTVLIVLGVMTGTQADEEREIRGRGVDGAGRAVALADVGLADLKGLTDLQVLSLGNTKVTDAGLVDLKKLTRLKELNLVGSAVTDVGLADLTSLANLQVLSLGNTKVSDAGAQEFEEALPKLRINR